MPYRKPKLVGVEDINKETPLAIVDRLEKKKKIGGGQTLAQKRRKKNKDRGFIKGQHFTEEEKLEAAAIYTATGSVHKVFDLVGIPISTLRKWKQQDWWPELIGHIRTEKDEELDTKLNKIIDKSLDLVADRLADGEYIYDIKRGEIKRLPVKAKDAAIITAISVDKRQLLRGQPTSRTERIGTNERLLKLAEEFTKFSKARDITPVVERSTKQIEEVEEITQDAQEA